jgi:hypothetical protein
MDGNTEAHVIRVLSLPLLLPPAFLYSFQTRQQNSLPSLHSGREIRLVTT